MITQQKKTTIYHNISNVIKTIITQSVDNGYIYNQAQTDLTGSLLTSNSIMIGQYKGNIDVQMCGKVSGTLLGGIGQTTYNNEVVNVNSQELYSLSGSFNGTIITYNILGQIAGSLDGIIFTNYYNGTYTYLSSSVVGQVITDPSNVPYDLIKYQNTNSSGKN